MSEPEMQDDEVAAEPVPVADQKAAGVPPEETVTIADQKQGAPLPDSFPQDAGAAEDGVEADTGSLAVTRDTDEAGEQGHTDDNDDATAAQQPIGATANETPTMAASATTAAAKAHAGLGHMIQVAQEIQREIGRYVPPDVLAAAERDVKLYVRSTL